MPVLHPMCPGGEPRCRERVEDGQKKDAGDDEIAFTATEFDLLAYLMGSPGRVYSREQLMRHVWGYDTVAGQRTVDVHVAQVRAKLGTHDIIRTVRGVGYAAEQPARERSPR